jgi:dynein heavy chain
LNPDAFDKLPILIENWFIFSLVWSVGATCDNDGRLKFSEWVRTQMEEEKFRLPIPLEGIVYDYFLDDSVIFSKEEDQMEDGGDGQKAKSVSSPIIHDPFEKATKLVGMINLKIEWKNWMSDVGALALGNDTKFSDIIVPTIDNIRSAFLVELLLKNDKPVLCVGQTGTGKTLTIANKLTRSMPKEFIPEFLVFSAKTSANQTQDLIDGKLDKRFVLKPLFESLA